MFFLPLLHLPLLVFPFLFFCNVTATTEIYTLSLHDALPICNHVVARRGASALATRSDHNARSTRSEEHTSELQSPCNLVCRLLLEKKKNNKSNDADNSSTHHSAVSLYYR